MLYSWFQSYPLSMDSTSDFVFYHISPTYWLGLPMLLGSLYILATKVKNLTWKWIIILGIFMSMYSLSYFYYMLPGPDSQLFRGLTEYFVATKDLNPFKPYHEYFEWPLFFILNQVATSLLGVEIVHFEFVLYAAIGFLFVTCLYIYSSRICSGSGYISVIAFFIVSHNFLNYQFAPFSLAMGLFLLLLILDARTNAKPLKLETTLLRLVIFTSMALMHPFVCTFYIFYVLLMYIINRNKEYLRLFLLTSTIYMIKLLFFGQLFIRVLIEMGSRMSSLGYSLLAELTFVGPATLLDAIAQTISRVVTITIAIILSIGFLVLLKGRKLKDNDRAIFVSGVAIAIMGALIPIVGPRAFPIVAIPISLGACYFWKSRFRTQFTCFCLISTILFTSISLHDSFFDNQVMFQTRDAYECANFIINHYNWNKPSIMLSHDRLVPYLQVKSSSENVYFVSDFPSFFPIWAEASDCIVYTVGLGKSFLKHNYSYDIIIYEGKIKFDMIFNSGFSYVATKASQNSTAFK